MVDVLMTVCKLYFIEKRGFGKHTCPGLLPHTIASWPIESARFYEQYAGTTPKVIINYGVYQRGY